MPKGTFIGFKLEEPEGTKFAVIAAGLRRSKSGLARDKLVEFINSFDKKTPKATPKKS